MGLSILQTERLILRPMTLDDFNFMRELDIDVRVCQYLGNGQIKTPEETKAGINRTLSDYEKYGLSLYIAEDKVTGDLLGRAGLKPWNLETGFHWEVGYTFAHTYWGKGYATEAARYLTRHAFQSLNADHVISLIQPKNTSSIRVAQKVGMKFWCIHMINGLEVSTYRLEKSNATV